MEKMDEKKQLNIKKALSFLKKSDNLKKFISLDNIEEVRTFFKDSNISVSNEDIIEIGYAVEGIINEKSIENVSGGVTSEVVVSAVCGSLGIILDAIAFNGTDGWGQDLFYVIRNSKKLGLDPEASANVAAGIGGVSHVVSGAAFAGAGYVAVKFVNWLKNKKGDK